MDNDNKVSKELDQLKNELDSFELEERLEMVPLALLSYELVGCCDAGCTNNSGCGPAGPSEPVEEPIGGQ